MLLTNPACYQIRICTYLVLLQSICYISVHGLHNFRNQRPNVKGGEAMITHSAHELVSRFFVTDIEHILQERHTEQETPEQTAQRLLIARASQGDQEAFGAIVHQYGTLMLRTA